MAWLRLRRLPGWLVALAVVLLALALRLLGLRLGLPYFHHPDECWAVDNAASMAGSDDWEPTTYQYGAPLSAITAWIFRTIGDLRPSLHWSDPWDGVLMRLLTRLVTAAISSSGAAGVYLAARHATPGDEAGRRRGLYAALLYATAAQLVTHGRYAVTDGNLVALVAWTLGFCALFLQSGGLMWAAGTVFFAATAFAFKVTAGPALIIPAVAFALRPVTVSAARLPRSVQVMAGRVAMLAAIPAALALFFLMNPHVILHWQAAIGDIQNRARQTVEGGFPVYALRKPGLDHLGAVVTELGNTAFHRWEILSIAAGTAAVAGLVLGLRDRAKVCVAGVAHAVFAVLAIALTSKAFLVRNYLVSVPVLCVGFGFAMDAMTRQIRAWVPARWWSPAPLLPAAFAVLYVAVPTAQAVRTERFSKDARVRAVEWIAAHAGGQDVTVAWTPDVISEGGWNWEPVRNELKRPHVTFAPDVKDEKEAAKSDASYVAIVSHSDPEGDLYEVWPFRKVDGYEQVAKFETSPYEDLYRFSVLVLVRTPVPPHGA
jgi:hypothetical protein